MALAEAVETNFDEDRLREAILDDHRRERRRLISFIALGVILLAAIGITGATQSRSNHDVATRIAECQTPGTPCATRAEEQFKLAVVAEYRAIVCYVSHPIPERTAVIADRCIDDALRTAGVAPPTGRKP